MSVVFDETGSRMVLFLLGPMRNDDWVLPTITRQVKLFCVSCFFLSVFKYYIFYVSLKFICDSGHGGNVQTNNKKYNDFNDM